MDDWGPVGDGVDLGGCGGTFWAGRRDGPWRNGFVISVLQGNFSINIGSHPNDGDAHFRLSEEQIFTSIFAYVKHLFWNSKRRPREMVRSCRIRQHSTVNVSLRVSLQSLY